MCTDVTKENNNSSWWQKHYQSFEWKKINNTAPTTSTEQEWRNCEPPIKWGQARPQGAALNQSPETSTQLVHKGKQIFTTCKNDLPE